MANFRRMIVTTLCSALLSVSAFAIPIDFRHHAVAAPVAITDLDREDIAMTYNDFVATAPYVVTLSVATHVPIKQKSLALLETRKYSSNFAVVQNANFEQ